jgi:hypothetical protein
MEGKKPKNKETTNTAKQTISHVDRYSKEISEQT